MYIGVYEYIYIYIFIAILCQATCVSSSIFFVHYHAVLNDLNVERISTTLTF